MNLLQAIILGIIQGLTEFIPISSSGHLIIAEKLMGLESSMTPQQITAFVAVMQLGTLAAVILYFLSDILSITIGWLQGNLLWLQGQRGNRGYTARKSARLGWLIIIGTIPIGVAGLLLKKVIEGSLTKSLFVIGTSMVVWALILWLAEQVGNRRREMEHAGMREALIVGFAQVFALIPGSSRSGTTIAGALFSGMTREAAARFSFLLSIPAVAASGVLEMREAMHILQGQSSLMNLLIATLVSAVVGYASIAFLISYLRRHSTYAFIAYRLVAGLILLALAAKGF
ncbi:MAG TPA: undecaprenyl-diphosphatase UppP [Blastocatellia bacterium]|nr:undecaprenyl-diphosphatase UppP [Blastocatellia bacterium]HMV86272.1 undecaprenyl-diphosphatase UppP [Blastocatellia bacterium]HMX30421.1 undecaprenyl-diphosphatase UppP [Blastocatellia bacterium]HMZ18528.1 undecaprenyl-diphosphatase UppP [Blastocatellia bacterium]HNG34592.1 undecaprenyl-diphosphatase UppP [Blastocatellia bacterium]